MMPADVETILRNDSGLVLRRRAPAGAADVLMAGAAREPMQARFRCSARPMPPSPYHFLNYW
jgi:hypothetical protein